AFRRRPARCNPAAPAPHHNSGLSAARRSKRSGLQTAAIHREGPRQPAWLKARACRRYRRYAGHREAVGSRLRLNALPFGVKVVGICRPEAERHLVTALVLRVARRLDKQALTTSQIKMDKDFTAQIFHQGNGAFD